MDFLTTFLIAIGLAMDAFAVSLGVGTSGQAKELRSRFRLAFHFGVFQGLMTVVGWLAGQTLVNLIANFDHWVAMGLLTYVGGRMLYSGFSNDRQSFPRDPSKGMTLVILAVATSLDALAVGLSMAMLGIAVIMPSIVIGLVALGLSVVGLLAGSQLSHTFGKRMEIIGGLILIGIGLRILITHMS